MTRLRSADGQVTVMAAVLMVFLVAMVAFVLDVGSWFRQQRISQSTVDAAALAGAQVLPNDPGGATTMASTFANKNGGVLGATITIGSKWNTNDMITVKQTKSATGFFSKVLGINTVSVHAKATAVAAIPTQTLGIAPITVNILHPQLSGPGCPCFNVPTTLPLGKTGAPGAFALLDLDNTDTTGTVGASTLASWISKGYDSYLPLGVYFSDPGAKWNNSIIQNALIGRYGTDLLFPVYDTLVGSGLERRVPRDRVGRLPPPERRRERHERLADGLLHANHLAGNRQPVRPLQPRHPRPRRPHGRPHRLTRYPQT